MQIMQDLPNEAIEKFRCLCGQESDTAESFCEHADSCKINNRDAVFEDAVYLKANTYYWIKITPPIDKR